MDNTTFLAILGNRHVKSRMTLNDKGKIYSTDEDRLGNFKSTGRMNGCTSANALWGMVSKHIIAVKDQTKKKEVPTQGWMDEYLGDIVNYMILLEAIWIEAQPVGIPSIEEPDFLDTENE